MVNMKNLSSFSQKIVDSLKNTGKRGGRSFKKAKPWLYGALFVGAGLAIVGFFGFTVYAAWVSRDLPDPNALLTRDIPQTTKIYDRTGTKLLYEIHGDEKRTLVKIEDVPDYAKHATIAIEDKNFYQHHGIYWQGLIRAVLVNTLKGQRISGTSTLTQQLVKNAILTNERSLDRKIREFILSLQIERRYTKDQILQLYFNEIPYGSTLYGIESASQSYFGKPAKDLTLDEAALLAAIPQRPDFFNPYGEGQSGDNRDRLVVRQHYILDLMAEQGYVTNDERDAAKAVDTLAKLKPRRIGTIVAPHFVMQVRGQLIETYGQKAVEQGGFTVITTLSTDMQAIAEEEIAKGVKERGETYKFNNAALVALDPKTGQVLAMVGSKDYYDDSIDGKVNVTVSKRQPGSSFKPIVYAAAFSRGYLPQTVLWDVNTVFKNDGRNYEPKNYNLKENGPISMRQALAGSLNIPAVKTLYLVGVSNALNFAEQLGYTTFSDRSRFGLSVVLGGGEVKPIEHANAFAAFANDGKQFPAATILKVTDPSGKVLQEWKSGEPKQVMETQVARQIADVLSDNNARAFTFGSRNALTLPDRPVAAKTGTTNDFHDAWTAGFTPNLVSVVWVGNTKNEEMKRGADGSIVAAPIWQGFMRRATADLPKESFVKPEPPTTSKPAILGTAHKENVRVNRITGKLATELTPPELIEERIGYRAHSILYYVDKDDPLGPPPTNPYQDPQFDSWERAVLSWVERTQWNVTSTIPTERDTDYTEENRPRVQIMTPSNNQTLSSRTFTVNAGVSGPRGVSRMEVYIDNQLLGTTYASPWSVTVTVPNWISPGFRTLMVRAYNDIGLWNDASISVNLTAEPTVSAGALVMLSPSSGAVWSRQSFPKDVILSVDDPSAFSSINVSFVGADGIDRPVASLADPASNSPVIRLPLGPPAGAYRLVVTGIRRDGSSPSTVSADITVTE